MANRWILIAGLSISLTITAAWGEHNPGHDPIARGGVVNLRQDVDAENQSRIAADEALQGEIDALKQEITFSDLEPCNNGDVGKSNGAGGWSCQPDIGSDMNTDTLAELGCVEEGDTPVIFNGGWVCQSDLPRFMDNGDGTVTDNETGLMWEKKLSDSDPACLDQKQALRDVRCMQNEYSWTADGMDGTAPNGTLYTDFLARLNLEIALSHDAICFANYCDWRLPTLWELRTILFAESCESKNPCIDEEIFGPTQAKGYWSSTTDADFPDEAWRIIFSTGLVVHAPKDTLTLSFARAVRRGR